jgi:Glutamine amidotransferase domain
MVDKLLPVTSDAHRQKCVAYLPSITSQTPLLTGLDSSLSPRDSATAAPTGPGVTSVSALCSSMSVLQLLALVSSYPLWFCPDRRVCGSDTGAQPLLSEDGKLILAVNGEIYNHIKLRASCDPGHKFKTHSDCEVIIPLVCRVHPFMICEINNLLISIGNTARIFVLYWMGSFLLCCSMSLSSLQGS